MRQISTKMLSKSSNEGLDTEVILTFRIQSNLAGQAGISDFLIA